MNREDLTNQHGALVPTETKAIKKIETHESALNTARQLYGVFVRACCLCGYHLDDFTITRNEYTFKMSELTKGAEK